ncbi:hypothetical protein [Neisseria meningitidis]|uniref:hypothetical protein n=1 Tax=Neisseria meningitidis TaxID=487 RepID=UPI00070EE9CE|nr:hypothetical protein [Neisseria meningitidis]
MTKGCGNHGDGEVSDGIVHPPLVIPAQAGIQTFGRRQYSKIIRNSEVLDSRFHGNDGMLRESWEWRNVSVITGMAKFQTALQVSEPM